MTATQVTSQRTIRGPGTFRPEIQALRALAVGMVVIYHLYPQKLTGGFVGVDVFFVISGYLITSHLVRGLTSTPRLRLRDFYFRRSKRLLPASLLVLLVVALLTITAVPQTSWGSIGGQLISSVFYVQNWALAADSVDYLAAGTEASPVQHFWSLSVEEQFYALWPLLLLGLVLLAKNRGASTKGVLLAGIGAVTLFSFGFSIWATWNSPPDAYFITPTRVWEFGIGALLTIVSSRSLKSPRIRGILSWVGLVGIALSAVLFTGATPFPGHSALLPVTATAAVIWAGSPNTKWGPTAIFNLRPVQFIGDTSYSIYLWHWPIIVLWPILAGSQGSRRSISFSILVIALSVLLGWLTKTLVEDRLRGERVGRANQSSSNGSFLVGLAVGMTVITGLGGTSMYISHSRADIANTKLAAVEKNEPLCFGADVFVSEMSGPCTENSLKDDIYPDPIIASADVAHSECQQRSTRVEVVTCTFGTENPEAFRVALVGDSHAGHWLGALESLANNRDWAVTTYLKSGCAFTNATSTQSSCGEWNTQVTEALDAQHFDLIITSSVSTAKYVATPGKTSLETAATGLQEAWTKSDSPIVALADIPRPGRAGVSDPSSCVDTKVKDQCSFPQDLALVSDPQKNAAEGFAHVKYVDMNKYFCAAGVCPAVAGNVLVYRDNNHMTSTFSRSLADHLEKELQSENIILDQ